MPPGWSGPTGVAELRREGAKRAKSGYFEQQMWLAISDAGVTGVELAK